MPALLLCLVLLLAGCGGPQRGVSTYLRQLSPYQVALREYQGQMRSIQQRPVGERHQAFRDLAAQVRSRGEELKRLQPPPAARALHQDFLDLYAVLAEYLEKGAWVGGPDDPGLREVAQRWQATLARAQADLDRLGQ